MDINYTSEQLDDDFHVSNGLSFTVKGAAVVLMAFVELNSAWTINGLSVEDCGEELRLAVLTSGSLKSPCTRQFKIKAVIEPVPRDWDGVVNIVVKEPDYV
jgi:hypothetical protein